jgi:type II secretory pathway pseudopilin PulG
LFVLAIMAVLAAIGIPSLQAYSEAAQLEGASDVFKGEFRKARSMAIASGAQTAIVFEGEGDDATFALYRDGNENGVRRADIRAGRDPLVSGPFPVTGNVSGVHVAINPDTPAIPPAHGTLDPSDPIRFGASNILSFSPLSTATPGTFYLAGRHGLQAGVRVTGGSSRVRVMICQGGVWHER